MRRNVNPRGCCRRSAGFELAEPCLAPSLEIEQCWKTIFRGANAQIWPVLLSCNDLGDFAPPPVSERLAASLKLYLVKRQDFSVGAS